MSNAFTLPGLEYLLLFGLPENKTEVMDGRMRTVWPFQELSHAERAFEAWCRQIERWREVAREPSSAGAHKTDLGGITLSRFHRVVEMEIPIHVDTLCALQSGFWRRELWDLPPEDDLPGYDSPWRNGHLRMNLWGIFNPIEERRESRTRGQRPSWQTCCWGDVLLTDDTNLVFDLYYFADEQPMQLIGGDFARGVPRMVAQILSPATREVDRTSRLRLLHRAGVRHVWLIDPALETLEALVWTSKGYDLEGTYSPGDRIEPGCCPGLTVSISDIFRDRHQMEAKRRPAENDSEPVDRHDETWRVDPARTLGIEYPLLLGHPSRRHEIWQDHSPCLLAFGSAPEARERMRSFLADAQRWTGLPVPRVLAFSEETESARVGPFQFTRQTNRVHLDVDVDPSIYLQMLETLADDAVWQERNQVDSGDL